jgi:hypothetical protein
MSHYNYDWDPDVNGNKHKYNAIKKNLENFNKFVMNAPYSNPVEKEFENIRRYYKSVLYELRGI